MAMRKADMEACSNAYNSAMAAVDAALDQGDFSTAVQRAISAWPHIDGMMQYATRYEDRTFNGVKAIDVVLRYAPLLLDEKSLDCADALLKEFKRIDRQADADLAQNVDDARERLWRNHRLWQHLEQNPGCRQDSLADQLGPTQGYWRSVVSEWETMQLICRAPDGRSYILSLQTRLDEHTSGRCLDCGHSLQLSKMSLLEAQLCPGCNQTSQFVIGA